MHMNSTVVMAAAIVLLAVMFFVGYTKGFIRIAFSLLSIIVSLVLVSVLAPLVTTAVKKTSVYDTVYEKVQQSVEKMVVEQFDEKEAAGVEENEEVLGMTLDKGEISKLYEKLKLPKLVAESINQADSHAKKTMKLSEVGENIAGAITSMTMSVVVFLGLFLVINLILRLIISLLDIISKIPVVNFMNRTAGGGIGLLEGLIIIWIIFLVVDMMSAGSGAKAIELIRKNGFLSFLYHNNILTNIVEMLMNQI